MGFVVIFGGRAAFVGKKIFTTMLRFIFKPGTEILNIVITYYYKS